MTLAVKSEPMRLVEAWNLTPPEAKVMAVFRTGTKAPLPDIAEALGMPFERLQSTMAELERRKLLSSARNPTRRYLAAESNDKAIKHARDSLHSALPVAVSTVIEAAASGDVKAAESIMDRTMGKPVQATVTMDMTPGRTIREMTEDELAAALSGHPLVVDVTPDPEKTGDAEI